MSEEVKEILMDLLTMGLVALWATLATMQHAPLIRGAYIFCTVIWLFILMLRVNEMSR